MQEIVKGDLWAQVENTVSKDEATASPVQEQPDDPPVAEEVLVESTKLQAPPEGSPKLGGAKSAVPETTINVEPIEEKEEKVESQIETKAIATKEGEVNLATEVPQANAIAKPNIQNFHLDQAEPLLPDSFPNPPSGDSKYLPATIPNVSYMLKGYGISVGYNVIKKTLQFSVPGLLCAPDNADAVAMAQIKSLARLSNISVASIEEVLAAIADRHQFNPVATWIKSQPWDGIDRRQAFYDTLTVAEDFPKELKERLMYRWMISGAAAVLMPQGYKSRGVLTLQGRQSLGKTSWIAGLVPDVALRESVVKLDHHLDAGDKDSKIAAATHWIVEIGELESSFSRNVSRLKGFITSDFDKIRVPYGRTTSNFPRKTVFSATVNDSRFLVDSTGNSRWWVIPVTEIDYQHNLDMQQIWAQFAVEYENGEQWWLTPAEEQILETCNNNHRVISVIEERVMPILDLSQKSEDGLPAMTPTALLMKIGYKSVSNPQAKECGALLRQHLGEPKKINGYQKWRIPFAKQQDITRLDEEF